MKNLNKGFTLIELLVVISIIGVLVGVLLTNFVGVRERAADTKRKNDLVQFKKALRLYYNDHQGYPGDDPAPPFSAGGVFQNADGSTIYMKEVPEYTGYEVSSDREEFILIVEVENASDSDVVDSQTKCCSVTHVGCVGLDTDEYVVCED